MAHFAEIDKNNKVLRVLVIGNDDCKDQDGKENEAIGALFCHKLFGGKWKQTSYNGNIRKNYAGVGFTYDESRDAFIEPKLFNSWTLNEETCRWEAPVEYPKDGKKYYWNEKELSWTQVEEK